MTVEGGSPTGEAAARFEATVQRLVGRRITSVDYWGLHNFEPEPERWDYGDWHHAVMGLQLSTDTGPVTVTWTNTFYPWGVEVFDESIERHLVLREDGPERNGPDGDSPWAALLGTPVRAVATWWDRLELGPATLASGEIVAPARSVDLPTALRLDFDAGPVWLVAGIPQWPSMTTVFIPGDEITVVFSTRKMREIGYDDPTFAP